MKRSLFLVSLSTVAVAAWTPRIASAQTASTHAQVLRRGRLRRAAVPGGCMMHRGTARWSSFTAADLA